MGMGPNREDHRLHPVSFSSAVSFSSFEAVHHSLGNSLFEAAHHSPGIYPPVVYRENTLRIHIKIINF